MRFRFRMLLCVVLFVALRPTGIHAKESESNPNFRLYSTQVFVSRYDPDYSIENTPTDRLYGADFSAGYSFSRCFTVQADFQHIAFKGTDSLNVIALRPFFRNDQYLLGLSYSYAKLAEFESNIGILHWEKYENDLLTVAANLFYEQKNMDSDQWAAELLYLIYLTDDLMAMTGVTFSESFNKQTDEDIVFRLEWFFPMQRQKKLSLKLQIGGDYIQQSSIGLKYYFNAESSLKKQHRKFGFSNTRFR